MKPLESRPSGGQREGLKRKHSPYAARGQEAGADKDFSDSSSYYSYYSSDSEDSDSGFIKATLDKNKKMAAWLKGKSVNSVSSLESKKQRSDAGSAQGLHHTLSSDRPKTALEPAEAARTEALPCSSSVKQAVGSSEEVNQLLPKVALACLNSKCPPVTWCGARPPSLPLPPSQPKADRSSDAVVRGPLEAKTAAKSPGLPKDCPAAGPSAAQKLQNTLAQVTRKKLADLQKTLAREQLKRKAEERKSAGWQKQLASMRVQLNAMTQENATLKAQLHAQKSLSGLSQGSCWQYDNGGCWENFTPEGNEKMHQAYWKYREGLPNSRYFTTDFGGVARVVDFELNQQKHLRTQKVRDIRLFLGIPPQWVTTAEDFLQRGNDLESFYKEVTDQSIWDSIRDIFHNTGHARDASKDCSCMSKAKIKSVHRVENTRLWHRYKGRLQAMRQDHVTYGISICPADIDLDGHGNIMAGYQQTFACGEDLAHDVDEKILLHGTTWSSANAIVREGFDHRTCKSALYGAGVYFACAACKSHQYTCTQRKCTRKHKRLCCHCKCERTLIIARVALGDAYTATETRKSERRPPVRNDFSGTHDSIVVEPGLIKGHHNPHQVHQEYVIFDREQAYPCYVVESTM